jgi:hypothetical protein
VDRDDLENYIGYMIRITGPRLNEPIMVKLLEVQADRIYVTSDAGDPFWLPMSEISIG